MSSLEDVLSRLDVFNKSTFKYMVYPVDWTFREVEHFTQWWQRILQGQMRTFRKRLIFCNRLVHFWNVRCRIVRFWRNVRFWKRPIFCNRLLGANSRDSVRVFGANSTSLGPFFRTSQSPNIVWCGAKHSDVNTHFSECDSAVLW